MRTVDNQSDPSESRWTKLRGDTRLLFRLVAMTAHYWTRGTKMRAAYRRCQRTDEIYYVDDPAKPEQRVR